MSNDSKKQGLYETLFKSIKAELGIDVEAEPEDPVKAFVQRFSEGKCDPSIVDVINWYKNGKRENFAKRYPEQLREFLWEICEQSEQKSLKIWTGECY